MASAGGPLTGRLALVTGGGSGIGRVVCQAFVKQGAQIAAVDVNEKAVEQTISTLPSGDHRYYSANVSNSSSVTDLLNKIKEQFSRVPSVAVNCAGISRDNFMLKMDEASFDEVLNVNLKGTFLVTQTVAKHMTEAAVQNGSIINISSIVGKVGNMGQCNYAASKAGVIGLTKTAAKEFAQFGIRCNTILPGFIETSMTETVPGKLMQLLLLQIPAGRMGKPEEIAETCVFLASDRSSYITGTAIEVAGGLYM